MKYQPYMTKNRPARHDIYDLGNGYEASVLQWRGSRSLVEIVVINHADGSINYDTPIHGPKPLIVGKDEIEGVLDKIAALPAA